MFANHRKLEQDQNKLFSAQFTTRTVHIGRCTLLKSGSKKNLKILKSAILARILTGNFIETVHVMRILNNRMVDAASSENVGWLTQQL